MLYYWVKRQLFKLGEITLILTFFDFQNCKKRVVGQNKLATGLTYKDTMECLHAKDYHSSCYNKKVAA